MITYGIATVDDLDMLVQMRVEFLHDMHPEYDEETLLQLDIGAREYIQKQLMADAYVGFLGKVDEVVVCSGALLIYALPPLRDRYPRKIGHVLNFYTKKEFRKCGYGQGLMTYIQAYAKENGFQRLFLFATEDGYPLYKKTGYIDSNKAMEYNLSV